MTVLVPVRGHGLRGIAHHTFIRARPVVDLEACRQATRMFPADACCFLNSYSLILAPRG
jgi:hypothetical protein